MNEFAVATLMCLCVLGGATVGAALRSVLPDHHIKEESRQVVYVAVGLVATLSALVLGLLVASAKSSFDARAAEVKQSAAKLVLLDRTLREYGPESREVRELMRTLTQRRIERTWNPSAHADSRDQLRNDAVAAELIRAKLWQLAPANDAQRWLHARALSLVSDVEESRWMVVEGVQGSIPRPFLVVLGFWLAAIFCALGLFAPRNATVYAVLLVCALSVSTAILMILEMDQPFEGILSISSAPLQSAVEEMKR